MKYNVEDTIAKVLAGQASEEETQALIAWRSESSENEQTYREMERAWEYSAKGHQFVPNTDAAWAKMQARIDADTPVVSIAPQKRSPRFAWIAAAVAAVLAVSIAVPYLLGGTEMIQVAATDEVKEVTLPDGSTVWLNRNSTMSYPAAFDGAERHVELDGQAFFEVTKNPSQPFVIATNRTETRVLGTSFDLRSYSDEGNDEIVVATGKVSFGELNDEENTVILEPGDKGTYAVTEDLTSKSSNTEENFLAWKDLKLTFNNASIEEVEHDLEMVYDIDLVVTNPEEVCSITDNFDGNTLEEVLTVISVSSGFDYSIDGNTVTVTGHCK